MVKEKFFIVSILSSELWSVNGNFQERFFYSREKFIGQITNLVYTNSHDHEP